MSPAETAIASLTKPTVTTTPRSILLTAGGGLAILLALVFSLLCVLIGVPVWVGLLVSVLTAFGIVWFLKRDIGDVLVASVGAVESKPTGGEARLINISEGLSLTGGIRAPKVYTIHDNAMNAAALASRDDSLIMVTSGLMEGLSRVELEGVVAELIARIKSGDAEVAATGSAVFGPLVSGPLSVVTKPLGVRLINRMYSSDRELLSDGSAVMLTRYPPGLLGALKKISAASSEIVGTLDVFDPVWLVPPVGPTKSDSPSTYGQASDLDLRIAVLAEL